jgi:hypothetical protein
LKILKFHKFYKQNNNNINIQISIKINIRNNNNKDYRNIINKINQINYLVKIIKIIKLLYNFNNKVHHLFLNITITINIKIKIKIKMNYIKNNLLLSMVVINKIKLLFNLFFNIKVVKI